MTGQPNILFFLTDNQRDDMMSCAGNTMLRTPNIDRLPTAGTRFSRAFATSPICAASRASYLTGLHEWSHRYTFLTPPFESRFVDISYPALLRAAGYRTGFVGKLGIDMESEPKQAGELNSSIVKMFDYFEN